MSISPTSSSHRFSPAASSTPPPPEGSETSETSETSEIMKVSHNRLKKLMLKSLLNFFEPGQEDEKKLTKGLKRTATKLASVAIHYRKTETQNIRLSKRLSELPYTFRFRKKANGKMTFFIEREKETLVGEGGFKTVKLCHRIDIDPDLNFKEKQYTVQKIKPYKTNHRRNERRVRTFISASTIFDEIYKEHKTNHNREPSHIGPKFILESYVSKNKYNRVEIFQPYVPYTLESQNLTTVQKLKILVDTADGLSKMHLNGYVHRDVKTSNISVDADGTGYINDFDLVTLHGSKKPSKSYYAWDHLAESGAITYNCDVYGLAFSAVEAFLPNFFNIIPESTDDKEVIYKSLQSHGATQLLINSLGCTPIHPNFDIFHQWFHSEGIKSPADIEVKLEELFPIERKIVEIFVREFFQSMVLEQEFQTLSCDLSTAHLTTQGLCEIAMKKITLTSAESLKSKFQTLLSSI